MILPLLGFAAGCDAAVDEQVPLGGAPGGVEAVDDLGRTVRLDGPATRIVSLLPGATETLVALGAGDRLVARTDYDDDPALAHLPSVGGGLTPSIELLASLRPDLVVAWEEAGAARTRPRLEALGIPVFSVTTQDTAGIFANVERFGRLVGLPERADSLAAAMRSELDAVRASVAGRERPTVLYMIGLDPPMVAGRSVFIGEVLEVAGGRNVFADVSAPSPRVSLEEIVRRRPDLVLLPASGASSLPVERLRELPGWRDLSQGTTRFEPLPADVLHRPGPSVVEAARVLRDVIHPDLAAPQ
ncbi:MAG: cobalamin-binding protein [Gemmatimonadota bacterium]